MFGFLYLRRSLVLWERLYFFLEEEKCSMSFSKNPASSDAETFSLLGAEVSTRPMGQWVVIVIVTAAGEEFQLRAETPEQSQEWFTALKAVQDGSTSTTMDDSREPMVRFRSRISFAIAPAQFCSFCCSSAACCLPDLEKDITEVDSMDESDETVEQPSSGTKAMHSPPIGGSCKARRRGLLRMMKISLCRRQKQ
eukprot:RCo021269